MNYASAHNIQRFEVTYLLENNIEIPLSLFRSTSLKHLSLEGKKYSSYRSIFGIKVLRATSTLELPALTTLCLRNATFCSDDNCVGLLSKCPNLKNLTLESCQTEGLSNFSISHPGLSDLTLDGGLKNVKVVNVVAPQLENLIIRCGYSIWKHVISAPALTSLDYKGYHPLHLSTECGFPSLKEVNICYSDPFVAHTKKCEDAHEIVQQLRSVEFLKLNLEFMELLFSSEELISRQPSPLVNLKNLTIYPLDLYERGLPKPSKVNSTEVKNYVLDSSPGATFKMTSREVCRLVPSIALIALGCKVNYGKH
uniref:uncharacterized protein LOC122610985 n=1 Tax=Erigeron canadensis TaxID=72917 RepID=UPI001CB8C94C|nr:uncharacterized protein LOC122610985 [Erigeron canadensis]